MIDVDVMKKSRKDNGIEQLRYFGYVMLCA